ncbi:AAA family ATPase [Amycolatopsis nivea]
MAGLRHVYWIGGAPGAGKSTIARRMAARYGWQHYATDDTMRAHAARTTPAMAPYLHAFLAMDMDERWVRRSPDVMLETFHWFRGEAFELIVEDLLALPPTPCVVDGLRLLPDLVSPLLGAPDQAVWLLPTPDFRHAAIEGRATLGESFIHRTSDPARAARNLAERDRMFTSRLREDTARLGLRAIEVDIPMPEEDLFRQVTSFFRL